MRERFTNLILVILALAAVVPIASAMNGYGTSTISVSPSSIGVGQGASGNVNYSVNLASGNTWGTNLVVTNQAYLASQGITVTISNPSGDPTFSGYLTISAASNATLGPQKIVLQATGDDPSSQNATLMLNILKVLINTTTTTTGSGSTTTPPTTSTPYTSGGNGQSGYNAPPVAQGYGLKTELEAAIVVILLITAFLLFKMKSFVTRLGIIGIALILIGTFAWLYGDFAGGLFNYIYAGIVAEILGIIIWIAGDAKAGAFKSMKTMATKLDMLGILLLIIGNALWLYADFLRGSLTYVWAGVALMLLGTLIWIIGDWKAGAFVMKKK